MKVSLVIRAYNEERHIGRLLDGVEKQRLPENMELEVILVDSGSTDSTVSIAEHMGAKVVHIRKQRFTFGRALNIGCEAASGDFLLFASAHVYPVYSDWIQRMVEPFRDQHVALVYGRQVGNEVTKFSEHQIFRKWFPPESNYHQQTPFCNNANCSIRSELWREYRYDERLTGLEDLAWANDIIDRGFHLVYEAEAVIVHVHEESFSKVRTRYMREALALKDIMPEVHFNTWDFVRVFTSSVINDGVHAGRDGTLGSNWIDILRFRYNQFRGTYLGHNKKGGVTQDLKDRFYYPKGLRRQDIDIDVSRAKEKISYD